MPRKTPVASPLPISIGVAAQQAGISPRMVRHYESLDLLSNVTRTDSGYRQYWPADVHTLRFIKRGRDLGFAMEEIRQLLQLWRDPQRSSAEVKAIAQRHIDDLTQRIAAMQSMQRTLQSLAECCEGNDSAECPILDDLAALQRTLPPTPLP